MIRNFLLGFTCIFQFHLGAQETIFRNDTVHRAIWVDMMKNDSSNFFQTQRAFKLYWKDRKTNGNGYNVFKRWEYMRRKEIDSNGFLYRFDVNNKGNQKHTELNKLIHTEINGIGNGKPCVDDTVWTEIGPYNLSNSGRLNSIAFHPIDTNVILVGAPVGGLWKSSDRGLTWTLLTGNTSLNSVSTIVINHKYSNIIYIGTGDPDGNDASGSGIYKSIDSGKTWIAANNGMFPTTMTKIVIDPINPEILLCSSDKGIYRSVNGGNNWKASIFSGDKYVKDLVIHPLYHEIVYATSAGNFLKSTDSGKTFTRILKGLPNYAYRCAIATTENDPSYVYFLMCDKYNFIGLYRSVNNGDSFTLMSTSPNLMDLSQNGSGSNGHAFYDMDIAVNPKNKNDVFVGGINIFRSVDGGKMWNISAYWAGGNPPYVHADIHALETHPLTKAIFAACDGGIFSNEVKWHSLSSGLGIHQTYKISTCNIGTFLSGFQDNGSYKTNLIDSKLFAKLTSGDGMDNAMNTENTDFYYTSHQNGNIYKNGGLIANNGLNGINEPGDWVTPFILQKGNQKAMFAGFQNIWRCGNVEKGVISFTNICDQTASSSTVFVANIENSGAKNDILYFTREDGSLFKSSNINASNPSWINLTAKKPISGYINDIKCDFKDSNTLYIAIGNKIYKSINGGYNWSNFSNKLPNVIVYGLVIDSSSPINAMYSSTSNGVYYYDSIDNAWQLYRSNLPKNVKVTDIEISYNKYQTSYNRIIASTYGRGIWSSNLKSFKDQSPQAKFSSYGKLLICKNKHVFFSDSSIASHAEHLWSADPPYVSYDKNDSQSINNYITFNKPGRYTVKKTVRNCIDSDSFEINNILVIDSVKSTTCHGSTIYKSNPGEFGIGTIWIGNNSKFSYGTKESGEYEDLSCGTIFQVNADKTYDLSVNVNPYVNEYVKIYIDLNDDGNFTEKEVVKTLYDKSYISDFIHIPKDIVKNKGIRMRLISDYYPIDTVQCPVLSYGQTEDHLIFVEDENINFSSSKLQGCIGDTILISDSSAGLFITHHWEFGADANPISANGKGPHKITYETSGRKSISLFLNNQKQLTKSNFIEILDKPLSEIIAFSPDSTFCEDSEIRLINLDKTQGTKKHIWLKSFSILSMEDSLIFPKIKLKDTGNYTLISNNGCFIDTSKAFNLTIYPKPELFIYVNDTIQCFNNNLFILKRLSDDKGVNYKWLDENSNTYLDSIIYINFTSSGNHTIELIGETDNNCIQLLKQNLVIEEMPDTGFTINKLGNLIYHFSPKDSSLLQYLWEFGDGFSSIVKSPMHTYTSSGSYRIKLIEKTNKSCIDSSFQTILVENSGLWNISSNKEISLYPNPCYGKLFIRIITDEIDAYNFTIYNSIGQLIYTIDQQITQHGNEFSLDIQNFNFPKGLYFLKVKSKNKTFFSQFNYLGQ